MAKTLWAVHIAGPDDLLACASRRLAARNATWINLGGVHLLPDLDVDSCPLAYAAPVPWTGDADGHAEALALQNVEDARWSDPHADVLTGLMRELVNAGPPTTIVYEIECPHGCDEPAVIRSLALDQPEEDGAIHIDVGMSVAQSTFTCGGCGCSVYTGDVDAEAEDDECPDVDEDLDEDDDDSDGSRLDEQDDGDGAEGGDPA
jgi:hypothetical protein